MSKEQIKNRVVAKLLPKYITRFRTDYAWAWTETKAAVKGTNSSGRQQITQAIADTRVIRGHLKSLAEAEADDLLANDSLDLTELQRIYGDG